MPNDHITVMGSGWSWLRIRASLQFCVCACAGNAIDGQDWQITVATASNRLITMGANPVDVPYNTSAVSSLQALLARDWLELTAVAAWASGC